MRTIRAFLVFVFGLALVAPTTIRAAEHGHRLAGGSAKPARSHHAKTTRKSHRRHTPSPVQLAVHAGYAEQYRDGAWVPVRLTLRNRTAATVSGTAEIADNGNTNNGPPQPFRSLYQVSVVIPGEGTKHVTLYVPSTTIQGEVDVKFRVAGSVVTTGIDTPTSFGSGDVSVGGLATDPADMAWLSHAGTARLTADVAGLTPQSTDTVPEALANLDVITLTDGATSQLTRDQLQSLDQYVHRGGALILVGGPGWQENLRPLPADLVPGNLAGTRTVPDLSALDAFASDRLPAHTGATTVSVLTHPMGDVLATERGVPLVVQSPIGQGQVLYVAFDPSNDPIRRWSGAGGLVSRMISRVAPQAAARGGIPQQMQNGPPFGFGPGPGVFFGQFGPMDIGTELSNVPAAALPSILLFILLTVLYVVFLGPVSYFSLRRMRRRELLWVSIPAGALLCVAVTFGVAFHLKGNTVLINSVGFVQLDGSSGPKPVSLYLGLFAPVRGDYNLTYDSPALPATVPRFDYFGGPQQTSRPLGLRLQEGGQTQVQFLSMNMWSMRNVALHSMVDVPGGIKSQLHVDQRGYIVGAVHNDTPLTLQHPAIFAGRTVYKLPDMAPEATVPVHVKPESNIYDFNHNPIWYSLYGRPTMGQPIMAKTFFFSQGPNFGGGFCCGPVGMSAPPEHSMLDRIRNVASRLPEAQAVSSLGEVVFVGWTTQPLGTISVDGASPQRRDLNLIESPLSLNFNPGPFVLRTGTLGARLVDMSPSTTGNNFCCGPVGAQTVTLPQFGYATFEFDIPHRAHLRFTSLHLYVDAGGADGIDLGRVYDWRTSKWVHEDLAQGYAILRNPQRFVSPTGTILVKLQPGDYGNPGRIQDVHQDIQISGTGVAS